MINTLMRLRKFYCHAWVIDVLQKESHTRHDYIRMEKYCNDNSLVITEMQTLKNKKHIRLCTRAVTEALNWKRICPYQTDFNREIIAIYGYVYSVYC